MRMREHSENLAKSFNDIFEGVYQNSVMQQYVRK